MLGFSDLVSAIAVSCSKSNNTSSSEVDTTKDKLSHDLEHIALISLADCTDDSQTSNPPMQHKLSVKRHPPATIKPTATDGDITHNTRRKEKRSYALLHSFGHIAVEPREKEPIKKQKVADTQPSSCSSLTISTPPTSCHQPQRQRHPAVKTLLTRQHPEYQQKLKKNHDDNDSHENKNDETNRRQKAVQRIMTASKGRHQVTLSMDSHLKRLDSSTSVQTTSDSIVYIIKLFYYKCNDTSKSIAKQLLDCDAGKKLVHIISHCANEEIVNQAFIALNYIVNFTTPSQLRALFTLKGFPEML
eukprot:gene34328-42338_t